MTTDEVIAGLRARGNGCFICRAIAGGLERCRALTPLMQDAAGEWHLPVQAQLYHIERELGPEARRAVEEIEIPME